ncbi:OmpH family outer membrane protein [bacterium]|nr:OmpH family outer membrane protein [bacterium]
MKNSIWFLAICALFFIVGYNINDSAISFPRYKVAVVDISQILSKSSELQSLKISQEKQMKELNTLVSKAQNEIANVQDRNKAIELEENYRQQIEQKRSAMDKEYETKVNKITSEVKTLISKEAKKSDYNLVLPTGMVISGGEDITQNVISAVK